MAVIRFNKDLCGTVRSGCMGPFIPSVVVIRSKADETAGPHFPWTFVVM
jgi:hypothetical protein